MPRSCRQPIPRSRKQSASPPRSQDRAEAWFFVGAAYGVRAQFRVYRAERFAAARDGKQIKEALEKALALDPGMHDAEFGIGMYRYYAGVAPALFKFLRFLLLLPGGDREGGLAQLERASQLGLLVRGEAQFQIHVLYLWYEHKSKEALAIIRGPAAALSAQPALPPDRGGDPRRLLSRSRREPQGVRAAAGARRITLGVPRRHRREGRAPQHREAVGRVEGAETQSRLAGRACRRRRLQNLQ